MRNIIVLFLLAGSAAAAPVNPPRGFEAPVRLTLYPGRLADSGLGHPRRSALHQLSSLALGRNGDLWRHLFIGVFRDPGVVRSGLPCVVLFGRPFTGMTSVSDVLGAWREGRVPGLHHRLFVPTANAGALMKRLEAQMGGRQARRLQAAFPQGRAMDLGGRSYLVSRPFAEGLRLDIIDRDLAGEASWVQALRQDGAPGWPTAPEVPPDVGAVVEMNRGALFGTVAWSALRTVHMVLGADELPMDTRQAALAGGISRLIAAGQLISPSRSELRDPRMTVHGDGRMRIRWSMTGPGAARYGQVDGPALADLLGEFSLAEGATREDVSRAYYDCGWVCRLHALPQGWRYWSAVAADRLGSLPARWGLPGLREHAARWRLTTAGASMFFDFSPIGVPLPDLPARLRAAGPKPAARAHGCADRTVERVEAAFEGLADPEMKDRPAWVAGGIRRAAVEIGCARGELGALRRAALVAGGYAEIALRLSGDDERVISAAEDLRRAIRRAEGL